jgi:hypothetical protein
MRICTLLVATLGLIGSASADSPRYLPAAGTTVTYRLLLTLESGGAEHTYGQVYRLTTTANDGKIAENTLTPLALVARCPDADTSLTCQQLRNLPNSHRDGDLTTVPLPADISSELAKIGKLTLRNFLSIRQVFPLPGLQDTGEVAKPWIGATPLAIQTTAAECDDEALKPFFPFGAAPQLTVPCKMTIETSQSRLAPLKDGIHTQDMKYELTYGGRQRVVVPAGAYDVAVIKFKSASASAEGPVTEGEWSFADNLGFSVKYSAATRSPASPVVTRIVRELIKVGQ